MKIKNIPTSLSDGEITDLTTMALSFHDYNTKAIIGLITEYLNTRETALEYYFDDKGDITESDIILNTEISAIYPPKEDYPKRFYKNFGKCVLLFSSIGKYERDSQVFNITFHMLLERLMTDLSKGLCHESCILVNRQNLFEQYEKLIERLETLLKNGKITDKMYFFCSCLIEQKHYENSYDNTHHFY